MALIGLRGPEVEAVAGAFREATGAPVHRFDAAEDLIAALVEAGADCAGVLIPWSRRSAIPDVRRRSPTVPVVVVAARADVSTAAQVVEAGASDLLVTGDDLAARVRLLLGKLAPVRALRAENRRLSGRVDARWALVGESPALAGVLEAVERVARVPRPVVLLGERGTGKELVAHALHGASGRRGPLVALNCAAVSDTLLDAELFGHEKGAYTGADRRAPGRFEQAAGGTLFLDEIGAMALPFQQKILRVVEYGEVFRVGGTEPVRVSARLIAATNADLVARVADGTFLADLWDRLAFEVIRVPPLRERAQDIPALARWFLDGLYAEAPELPRRTLGDDALRALAAWSWPGNVRELKHAVERAACRPGTGDIRAEELGLGAGGSTGGGFHQMVEDYERALLSRALARAGGNQAAAARDLGLTYDQLRWYRRRLLPR